MSTPHSFSIPGRLRSIGYAIVGIGTLLKSQQNAWIHAAASAAVITLGFLLQISGGDWCWLILAMMAVWTAETLNTAFEFLADAASPDFHPLVKKAKDVAAGAVLLSAIGAAVIGLLVLGPPLLQWIQS